MGRDLARRGLLGRLFFGLHFFRRDLAPRVVVAPAVSTIIDGALARWWWWRFLRDVLGRRQAGRRFRRRRRDLAQRVRRGRAGPRREAPARGRRRRLFGCGWGRLLLGRLVRRFGPPLRRFLLCS